jgi:hypothetical protein
MSNNPTKLTTERRQIMMRLLNRAYDKIINGDEIFVCVAISSSADEIKKDQFLNCCPITYAENYLRLWVMNMLKGVCTLERWLKINHPDDAKFYDSERLKITRLMWIDWMYAQLRKGK